MKAASIAISLLFVSGLAWGCESYEDCMHKCTQNDSRTSPCTKAIAYKLDEISKKISMFAPTDDDAYAFPYKKTAEHQ